MSRFEITWEWDGTPPQPLPKILHPHVFQWESVIIHILNQEGHTFDLSVGGKRVRIHALWPHHAYLSRITPPQRQNSQADWIKAPMPGLIKEIRVQVGQKVTSQTPLLILEAMKMENVLFAPYEGIVKEIAVTSGNSVEKNAPLVQLEPL